MILQKENLTVQMEQYVNKWVSDFLSATHLF